MLAASASYAFGAHAFLPQVPSPLSSCGAAIYGRRCRNKMSSGSTQSEREPSDVRSHCDRTSTPFSQRPIKKAPGQQPDELRDRRRNAFLRKVQDSRDNKRAEVRAEDIMRLDFLRRKRAWEAQQASMAVEFAPDMAEDDGSNEFELPTYDEYAMQLSQQQQAEEVWQREHAELEALIESMPTDDAMETQTEHFGSDDEEYDAVFSELLQSEGEVQMVQSSSQTDRLDWNQPPMDEVMDMR